MLGVLIFYEAPVWLLKFLIVFIPSALASGFLFGAIYVAVAKELKVDRQRIEERFEKLRSRLGAGPFPIFQTALPFMRGAVTAIYGKTVSRRLLTSFVLSMVFTSCMFSIIAWRYRNTSSKTQIRKSQVEREADPVLYEYTHDPKLLPEYLKSEESVPVSNGVSLYKYRTGIYNELHVREMQYYDNLQLRIARDPDRAKLTLLFLIEGDYRDPGFQFGEALFLFLFNTILDFASATAAIRALWRLSGEFTLRNILTILFWVGSTLLCLLAAFLSYRLFFRGHWAVFEDFAEFAVGTGMALLYLFILYKIYKFCRDPDVKGTGYFSVLGFLFFSSWIPLVAWAALTLSWSSVSHSSLELTNWRDLYSFPYVLAVTTLAPACTSLAAFILILLLKVTSEPARILQWSYMTFVKEEVGGTQASAIILSLGILVGAIVACIWTE
jgi:hypothetical protein